MTSPNAAARDEPLSRLKSWVTLLGLLGGFAAGIAGGVAAVYGHFAKAADLAALQCSVVVQNDINNEMITASGEVKVALKLLQQNLAAPQSGADSVKVLVQEMSTALAKIDKALEKVGEARAKRDRAAIRGGGPVLRLWLLLAGVLAQGAQNAAAQTVALGTATVRGACAAVQAVSKPAFAGLNSKSSEVLHFDGTVEVAATIISDKRPPDAKPDERMSGCAKSKGAELLRTWPGVVDGITEEALRHSINECLAAKGAAYKAKAVILRRGPVKCAETPPDAVWHDPLRAELKRCAEKDNFLSQSLCEYRARDRFCDPGNHWGKVAECQQ